jgi:hypothetical protein
MELDYFQVLTFLTSMNALNKAISIEPLITQVIPNELSFEEWSTIGMEQINKLLNKLEEDKNIKISKRSSPNKSEYAWNTVKVIMVELTQQGELTLKDHLKHELSIEVDKSTISTNQSVIKTNNSVAITNDLMVQHSTLQLSINRSVALNATNQTSILKRQTFILWASVIVAVCSAFISYISYRRDVPDNQFKQELTVINKRIDTLMQRLPQTRNIPPIKTGTKISPQKK